MYSQVDLIGVPFDLGGGGSGARYGPYYFSYGIFPEELMQAGIITHYHDLGVKWEISQAFGSMDVPSGLVHYEREVAQMAKIVRVRTEETLLARRFPVVVGGDHSISIGSISGALQADVLSGRKLGLIWIDAHFDAHTHLTSHSHRAHGLPLATLLGHGPESFIQCLNAKNRLSPFHVVHIGAGENDCEPEEYTFFEKMGIPRFSRKYLQENGWSTLYSLLHGICKEVDLLWVSLDLDAIDHSIAPGVYYPNPNGLQMEEILELAEVLSRSKKVCGVDIMEYNPQFDRMDDDFNPLTIATATKFLLRLLGR